MSSPWEEKQVNVDVKEVLFERISETLVDRE